MNTTKTTFAFVSLLIVWLAPNGILSQQQNSQQIYRGWYQFHRTVNEMEDLTVHDRVNIIFALQDSLEDRLPIDYQWKPEQIDGMRSLILKGFTYEFPPEKIAGACVTLFDAYRLGAVHPEIIEFLDLLLAENISAEMLTRLTRAGSSLNELPDEIRIQFLAEVINSDWDAEQIQAATKCLSTANLKKLDMNQTLVGTIVVLSQVTGSARVEAELQKMLVTLEAEKARSQRLSKITAIANQFRGNQLSDNYLNGLIAEAMEAGWGKDDFEIILSTIIKGAKNGLPYQRLANSIVTRLSGENEKSVQQVCEEEYQNFYQQFKSNQEEIAHRDLTVSSKQRFEVDYDRNKSNTNVDVNKMYEIIQTYLGTPYRWGGTSRYGIDCSGLTQNVFRQCGLYIPRTSRQQYYNGIQISRSEMKIGDLVFFRDNYFGRPSHVGIYLGNNQFCHASCSRGVTISNLNKHYYRVRFIGAKRYW